VSSGTDVRDSSPPSRGAREAGWPRTRPGGSPDRPRDPERAVVLYDRDCGFCRWSLARLLDLDRRRRLRPVALQDPEAYELLQGMEDERRYASAHLVTADGTVYSGGAGAAPLLDLLPGGAPYSLVTRLLTGPLSLGYGLVARNRGLLGRRLSTRAKERALEQIDRHATRPPAG